MKTKTLNDHLQNLTTLQRQFIEIIMRNSTRSKGGRRYTSDEILLCLSIYKKSAAAYRYLCTFLPLPNPRNIRKVLTRIRLDCGVTRTMKEYLKESVNQMKSESEKICVLMWDEVSLKLHTQFCPQKNNVIGVEDWGSKRTTKYADHALVFMLRGIETGWKVPLSYNFCSGQTTHEQFMQH